MGSLPSRRKQIATQPSPQSNVENSQALGLSRGARPQGESTPIAVAVCNFPSGHAEPMLWMGEQLNLLSEDGEWWKVESVTTGKGCYVPSNHVAKISHGWLYEGISRSKAEELLLLPSNSEGYFLVRESQMKKGIESLQKSSDSLDSREQSCYSLSIRHTNRASWDCVKHYRINCMENGWLYISPRLTFSSLQELVEYYSEVGDGLCCCLKEPCFIQGSTLWKKSNLSQPMVVKKPALNWEEISRLVGRKSASRRLAN
ncbi:src-like-adapter 2 isoform X3 [Podarcis muralis]